MRIAVGADHGGFALRDIVIETISGLGHDILDVGAFVLDEKDDYPDYAFMVADAVAEGRAHRGIMLCGSGVGAAIAAKKVAGVRASVCHDTYSAQQGVEHDAMNVLCIGARVIGDVLAEELTRLFLSAEFSGEVRYARRLDKVNARDGSTN